MTCYTKKNKNPNFVWTNKTNLTKLWSTKSTHSWQYQRTAAFVYTNSEHSEREIKKMILFTIAWVWASQVPLGINNLSVNAEDIRDSGSILGQEDPLEEGMATHSSSLAWRIPMDRGAWWATVHGVARMGHDWSNLACT